MFNRKATHTSNVSNVILRIYITLNSMGQPNYNQKNDGGEGGGANIFI